VGCVVAAAKCEKRGLGGEVGSVIEKVSFDGPGSPSHRLFILSA
jgi:hypothetical protein